MVLIYLQRMFLNQLNWFIRAFFFTLHSHLFRKIEEYEWIRHYSHISSGMCMFQITIFFYCRLFRNWYICKFIKNLIFYSTEYLHCSTRAFSCVCRSHTTLMLSYMYKFVSCLYAMGCMHFNYSLRKIHFCPE